MKKSEFVAAIAEKAELTKKDAARFVDVFQAVVTDTLVDGEKVSLVGFGSFETKHKEAGTARNPRTGETVQVAAKNVPKFKASSKLKEAINA